VHNDLWTAHPSAITVYNKSLLNLTAAFTDIGPIPYSAAAGGRQRMLLAR